MTTATSPTTRYVAQACDTYCQHPCGCKFHVRAEHFSGGKEWHMGTVFQHCDDMVAAKQAATDFNKDMGWKKDAG